MFRPSRKKCPSCKDGQLEAKNILRATLVDDQGQRYPDSWSYYLCEACDAKLKIYINGRVEMPTDEEWIQHCSS